MNRCSSCIVPMPVMYTISRCRKDDTEYGPIHYSADARTAFCGMDFSVGSWWIVTNDFSGIATCRKCLKVSRA